ncbi:MAG TPA: malate synthase G, partial [Acetobacteraceae bacterium]|nr:malate synthase G [Acetobacteraceae bacterium]
MDQAKLAGLTVSRPLADFVANEALPGTGLTADRFWQGFAGLVADFASRNRALLARRNELQAQIDAWHITRRGKPVDDAAYRTFLTEIGYLLPPPPPFEVSTANVDDEIARIAGPQLVVPVNNARYALNAGNARWGSLYDALYGTNALPEDDGATRGRGYNPVRGARVVAEARKFLDRVAPLSGASHGEVTGYAVVGGRLTAARSTTGGTGVAASNTVELADPAQFAGYQGEAASPSVVLLRHNGLHVELHIDRAHPIGRTDPAGLADVVIESAITTIMDCEDSVAAVDAADKVDVYRNWLGLMRNTLSATFPKGDRTIERRLNPDRSYTAPDGGTVTLHGRSLMLVRNVGHHMMT